MNAGTKPRIPASVHQSSWISICNPWCVNFISKVCPKFPDHARNTGMSPGRRLAVRSCVINARIRRWADATGVHAPRFDRLCQWTGWHKTELSTYFGHVQLDELHRWLVGSVNRLWLAYRPLVDVYYEMHCTALYSISKLANGHFSKTHELPRIEYAFRSSVPL